MHTDARGSRCSSGVIQYFLYSALWYFHAHIPSHFWNSHQEQFGIQDLAQGLLDMQPELPIGALTLSLVDDLLDLPSCPGCAWEIKSLLQLIFKHEINIHPNFSRLKQQTTILIRRCILLMSSSSVVVITLARWKWSLCGQEKSLFPLMVLCVPVSWISFSPVQTWSWSLHLLVLVCFLVIVHHRCSLSYSFSLRKTKNVMNSNHSFLQDYFLWSQYNV